MNATKSKWTILGTLVFAVGVSFTSALYAHGGGGHGGFHGGGFHGGGFHGGGYHGGGYHGGYYRGGYYGGGNYGYWGGGFYPGINVVVGSQPYNRCLWVKAHYNRAGYLVPAHRVCRYAYY